MTEQITPQTNHEIFEYKSDYDQTIDLERSYITRAAKFELLTAEQEIELAQKIEAGNYAQHLLEEPGETQYSTYDLEEAARQGAAAREEFINANLLLVVKVVNSYRTGRLSRMDLIQAGNLGLVEAVDHFDYMEGRRFSTFAWFWIRKFINEAIREATGRGMSKENYYRIKGFIHSKRDLAESLGHNPTKTELARYLEASYEQITDLELESTYLEGGVSLNIKMGDDSGDDKDCDLEGIVVEDLDPTYSAACPNDYLLEIVALREDPNRPWQTHTMAVLHPDDRENYMNTLELPERQMALKVMNAVGVPTSIAEAARQLDIKKEEAWYLLAAARGKLKKFMEQKGNYDIPHIDIGWLLPYDLSSPTRRALEREFDELSNIPPLYIDLALQTLNPIRNRLACLYYGVPKDGEAPMECTKFDVYAAAAVLGVSSWAIKQHLEGIHKQLSNNLPAIAKGKWDQVDFGKATVAFSPLYLNVQLGLPVEIDETPNDRRLKLFIFVQSSKLTQPQRDLISSLYRLDGGNYCTIRELSQELGIPECTCGNRVRKALQDLRKALRHAT